MLKPEFLSQKPVATTIVGGYIYIILPDVESPTGFKGYQLKIEDFIGQGVGDVLGPNISVNNNIVLFNGIGGKTIKDSGIAIANIPVMVAGKIPSQYIPGSFDDVIELLTLDDTEPAGTEGELYYNTTNNKIYEYITDAWTNANDPEKAKIYIAIDSGLSYRWSGSVLAELSATPDLAQLIHGATAETSILDADETPFCKAVGGVLRKLSFANLKSSLKAYFDNLYLSIASGVTQLKNVSYLPNLDITKDIVYCTQYIQNTVLEVVNTFSNGAGSYFYVSIVTNGANINFPATWKELKNEYINDSKIYGLIAFYDGYVVQYQLYLIKDNDITINFPIANIIGVFKVTNESSFVSLGENSSELRAINNPSFYFTSQNNGKNVINNFHESSLGEWYYLNSGGTYEELIPESCTIGVRMAMPAQTGNYPLYANAGVNDFIGRFTGETRIYFQRSAAPPNIYWTNADNLTHTFIFIVIGTSLQIYVDNILVGTGTVGAGPMQVDRLFRHSAPIKFNSIAFYSAPLALSERTQLHNWLNYDM